MKKTVISRLILALASITCAGPVIADLKLGPQCQHDSECAAPLVCREFRCRVECQGHRDCPEGYYCVKTAASATGASNLRLCAPKNAIHPSWFPTLERDTDRYGDDLRSFPIRRRDPLLCHDECERTPQCVAWTYAEPGVNGAKLPRCYLKKGYGAKKRNTATVSGTVKTGAARIIGGAAGAKK